MQLCRKEDKRDARAKATHHRILLPYSNKTQKFNSGKLF